MADFEITKVAGQQDWAANFWATSGNASGAQAERNAKPDGWNTNAT